MKRRFETFTALISKINRDIKKLKKLEMAEYGLRSAEISCLYFLYTGAAETVTDLAESIEEDKATVSRSLDSLERLGYVVCEADGAKRYNSAFTLTESGAALSKLIAEKIGLVLEDISLALSEEERESFYRSLGIISRRLDAFCKGFE